MWSSHLSAISSFFVFLRIRQPPRSTLFPSPTLFRSNAPRRGAAQAEDDRAVPVGAHQRPADRNGANVTVLAVTAPRARDRKSTRLNSSHANISYAVFCLKKKKKY